MLALYRKYRPKTFSEIVNQKPVTQTLTNAISNGEISHAYLFSGPKGSGKTTIARLLAKSVNCLKRKKGEYEPCNQCDNCQEINQGNSIDLIEIDAASHRGIDEIRELKDGIKFVPTKSKYKVFIVDESHQLTKEAANALLKTLEEPPAHVIFVLATTEIHKMIPTIISRCQRFDFRPLKIEEIISRLEKILENEKVKSEKEALFLIAKKAEGSVRDAESLLDQIISFSGRAKIIRKEEIENLLGIIKSEIIFKFLNYLFEKDVKKTISFLNELVEKGYNIFQFLKETIDCLRTLLFLKIDPEFKDYTLILNDKEEEEIRNFAQKLKTEDIHKYLEKFSHAEEKMKYSSIPQLPIELAIIEICEKTE